MKISLVVAAAHNNVIGINGKIPWRLPNDMKHFKNITWGLPLIMGRKTFESLGRPLPGRKNIILSRTPHHSHENALFVKTVKDALFVAAQTDAREVMIIGGGEIYKLFFNKAKRIYLTRVDDSPKGDTYFPALSPKSWKLVHQQNHEADDKNPFNHSFQVWERIN
ncbi:MAG: type 3 dihydrofolate reductase [Chitinophagaceae bacterium]|nr:type 3 dihydrofolate reductase [Chitinophagaceae bacterium]